MANKQYNYLSPDGFTIRMEDFNTKEEADAYLDEWVKRYERQGYYSSASRGRISLDILKESCDLITQ